MTNLAYYFLVFLGPYKSMHPNLNVWQDGRHHKKSSKKNEII